MPLNDLLLGGGVSSVNLPDLVQRVRRWLEDFPWEDQLSAAVSVGATTLTLANPASYSEGDIIEIDDDTGSCFRVLPQTEPMTNPVHVRPGWNGTPDVTHPTGSYIRKSPRFLFSFTAQAIQLTISELWPFVWKVRSRGITPVTGQHVYELPSDLIDLVGVAQVIGTAPGQTAFYYGVQGTYPVSIQHNVPFSLAGQGQAIEIPTLRTADSDIIVTYRSKLVFEDIGDGNITDGLLADCIVMGACWKLLTTDESRRVSESQRVNDLAPAGSPLRVSGWFKQQFEDLRKQLYTTLKNLQPPMGVWK